MEASQNNSLMFAYPLKIEQFVWERLRRSRKNEIIRIPDPYGFCFSKTLAEEDETNAHMASCMRLAFYFQMVKRRAA